MCLGSLSYWKVNLRPSLRSWVLWTMFSFRISLYFTPSSFFFNPDRSPSPPKHDAATTMLQHLDGIGQVMSGAWFLSDMTVDSWFHQTTEFCFSQSECPLGPFLWIPSGLSCVSWLLRSVECCSDGCPFGSFFHVDKGSLELSQREPWVCGNSFTKALFLPLLSLVRWPVYEESCLFQTSSI